MAIASVSESTANSILRDLAAGREVQESAGALTADAGAAPAGGTGDAAGAWDTAANRDLAIATINATRTRVLEIERVLKALGITT